MLAMPVFSMTAKAQQTQQARRQGAPRGRGTPEVAPRPPLPHSRDDGYVLNGQHRRPDLNQPDRGRQVQQNQLRPLGQVRTVQQLQQLDRK